MYLYGHFSLFWGTIPTKVSTELIWRKLENIHLLKFFLLSWQEKNYKISVAQKATKKLLNLSLTIFYFRNAVLFVELHKHHISKYLIIMLSTLSTLITSLILYIMYICKKNQQNRCFHSKVFSVIWVFSIKWCIG